MAKMLDSMEALLRGEVPPPAAATLLGMRLVSFAAGEALVQLDATAAHGNPMGTVQGGIFAAIADAAMEMKVNFLRAVRTGRIAARALVKNAVRTLGLIECDVLDADGKLVAHAVSTCMILRAAPAEGR